MSNFRWLLNGIAFTSARRTKLLTFFYLSLKISESILKILLQSHKSFIIRNQSWMGFKLSLMVFRVFSHRLLIYDGKPIYIHIVWIFFLHTSNYLACLMYTNDLEINWSQIVKAILCTAMFSLIMTFQYVKEGHQTIVAPLRKCVILLEKQ